MDRSGRWGAAVVGVVALLSWLVAVPTGAIAAANADDDPFVVRDPQFVPLDGVPLVIEGVGEYRGDIRVTNASSGLAAVNVVELEDYLKGISEVPTTWLLEAQKAQAIAARTYALYEMGRTVNAEYKNVGADLCATDSCQVYAGVAKERRPGSGNWSAAVQQTAGQALLYRGAPIVAKYSSSNGGQTVAGGQPYLRAVADPDDIYSPLHQWSVSIPAADVAKATGLPSPPVAAARQGDDVVTVLRADDGTTSEQRIPAADFRSRLNGALDAPAGFPLVVPSIRYSVALIDGMVRVDGRGWGHGIGLSQYGALGKAARGLKAPDILAAYYAGLRPVTVPAQQFPDRVRVAVALGRAGLEVGGPGRFRILDSDGTIVAHSATGTWSTRPMPDGRVRLVPPADQAVAPQAALSSVQPEAPRPGDRVDAELQLSGPQALTRIVLVDPAGQAHELDSSRMRRSGPVKVRLGPSSTVAPGDYRIEVERDAGKGRASKSTLTFTVASPTPRPGATAAAPSRPPRLAASAGPGPASGQTWPTIGALLLLGAVGVTTVRVGRRRTAELH